MGRAAAWARSTSSKRWKALDIPHPVRRSWGGPPWASPCRPTAWPSPTACAPTWTLCPRAASTAHRHRRRGRFGRAHAGKRGRPRRAGPPSARKTASRAIWPATSRSPARARWAAPLRHDLTDGVHSVAGIMFHCPIDQLMRCDSVVNAAFEVQIDEWRGRRSVKAMLENRGAGTLLRFGGPSTRMPCRSPPRPAHAPLERGQRPPSKCTIQRCGAGVNGAPCCDRFLTDHAERPSFPASTAHGRKYAESDSELCADCADDPEEDNRRRGARAQPRPLGGHRRRTPRRAAPRDHRRPHRRRRPVRLPARGARRPGSGRVDPGRHGNGPRQVAHLPAACGRGRPCQARGEPVRLPAARAHRRPGLPRARIAGALRHRRRSAHRRIDPGRARHRVRGPGTRLGRHRAHHARVPQLPRSRVRHERPHPLSWWSTRPIISARQRRGSARPTSSSTGP